MRKWASAYLSLLGAESLERFIEIQKRPEKLDNDKELRNALLDFIADFADWDKCTEEEYLQTSRALTQAAHEALGGGVGTKPLVVDPFAGGGSIPLEALRVGAEAFASDLNPVPVLLNKVALEYAPKYGQKLADEVRKWGDWVRKEAETSLSAFYPKDSDGSTPIAYLWARTIQCEGPACGYRVPIMGTFYLRKKAGNYVRLALKTNNKTKSFDVEIIEETKLGSRDDGTAHRSSVTCPRCQFTTSRVRVESQVSSDKGGARHAQLMAVVTTRKGVTGRFYRPPDSRDLEALERAQQQLDVLIRDNDSALSFIPDEELPYLRSIFNVHVYGVHCWGDLFAPRQQLALGTLCSLLRRARKLLEEANPADAELNRAVLICLAFAIDKHADFNSSISRWANHMEKSVATFGRQALGMLWDWGEMVPIGESTGSFPVALDWCIKALDCVLKAQLEPATVQMVSATNHSLPDSIANCLITDPPYYDAVPYADLSDYFYVWLKRSLEGVGLEYLNDPLSPKEEEVVQLAERNPKYAYKTKERFEQLMREALTEGRRYVAPDGLGVVVFAHKTTEGWEAMLEGLIGAGWVVTASWPIDTEKPDRPRAQGSAALASSIHLVCRPRGDGANANVQREEIGDWRDVLQELPRRIHEWMPRLADEGVVGADAIFACLGPALEVFSRYRRVEKANGDQVALKEYLVYVWAAVAKEALAMVFAGADASGFEEDARVTAIWLWTLFAGKNVNGDTEPEEADEEESSEATKAAPQGYVLEYDAARKIAQGLGAHLESLPSLVEIKGDTARLLSVAERTRRLFGKESGETSMTTRRKKSAQLQLGFIAELEEIEQSSGWGTKGAPTLGVTVLDWVHQCMILFAAGRGEALRRFLVDEGVGRDERFWRLAQVLSYLYPKASDEKRWIDGVLARKKGLGF
jgi:adenine-specific DNA methylase